MNKKVVFGLLIIALSFLVIAGCATSPAPEPAPEPAPAPTRPDGLILDGAGNYTVVRGDTLADIAARRYGESNMYYFPLIRLANANVVSDPDVIEVETVLVIPDLQRNLNDAGAARLVRADILAVAGQYDRQSKPNAAERLRNLASRISQ